MPIVYAIAWEGDRVRLEAYVENSTLIAAAGLPVMTQMELASGGWYLVLARNAGRKTLNALLARLGHAPLT